MKLQSLSVFASRLIAVGCLVLGCSSNPVATNGGSSGSSGSAPTAGSPATTGGTSAGGTGTASSGAPGTSGSGPAMAGTGGSSGGQSFGGQASSSGGMSSGGTSGSTAVGSNGCGKTSTLTFGAVPNESGSNVGTGTGGWLTIQSSGQTRGFSVRLPANYDMNHPYPLIFAFHWNGGTSDQLDTGGSNGYWWAYYGLQRKSNNGAIFVAPQGLGNGWPNSGGQDLTFTDDMVKLLEDNLCVDTTHLITSGFSYGGGMSYEIACARAKVFRAAVIYEGGQLSGCDGGNDPIALWQVEGLTDTTVNMSFATPIRDRFVKNNGCTAQDPPQPPQPPPYLSTGGHICTDYSGCSSGHPLRWCVSQSGHAPGPVDGTSDLYNSCATPPKSCSATCPCTWTPDDVWAWLTSF
jgi:poly(3-hydroxybutyrate) depolymerase